jgi:hypothetical protein
MYLFTKIGPSPFPFNSLANWPVAIACSEIFNNTLPSDRGLIQLYNSLFSFILITGQPQCWIELPEPWHWQLYISSVAVALFVIPACIITFCYAVIVATIWAQGRVLNAHPSRAAKVSRVKTPNRTSM